MNRILACLLLALAAAAVPAGGEAPPERGAIAGAIFVGDLPCADCAGLRYRLHLRSDRAFVLETRWLGKEQGPANPAAVLGVWAESADGRTLELRQAGEPPLFFAIRDAETLRKLDTQGRPIRSRLNYDLVRSHAVEKFQPRLSLQGMYSYMADAGRFRECVSRAQFPVAQVADNAALERGYTAARAGPGQEILVAVEARIAAQPSMEGDRLEDALVVERFVGAWPGETCGDPFAGAALTGTYWKLTRLGTQGVAARSPSAEPHLVLTAEGSRVSGSGGCNRFTGAFRQDGASLDLGRIAATMMACMDTMEQEQAYFRALQATARWKIVGSHLELYDGDGNMVARFEARHDRETTQ